MIDRTLEFIDKVVSSSEKAVESPKQYWLSVLSAGLTISFLILCSAGFLMFLVKIIFL